VGGWVWVLSSEDLFPKDRKICEKEKQHEVHHVWYPVEKVKKKNNTRYTTCGILLKK
jgi:hypothetical protein